MKKSKTTKKTRPKSPTRTQVKVGATTTGADIMVAALEREGVDTILPTPAGPAWPSIRP